MMCAYFVVFKRAFWRRQESQQILKQFWLIRSKRILKKRFSRELLILYLHRLLGNLQTSMKSTCASCLLIMNIEIIMTIAFLKFCNGPIFIFQVEIFYCVHDREFHRICEHGYGCSDYCNQLDELSTFFYYCDFNCVMCPYIMSVLIIISLYLKNRSWTTVLGSFYFLRVL